MRLRMVLMATACAVLPALAHAQPVQGPYVSLGAGGNFLEPSITHGTLAYQYFGPASFLGSGGGTGDGRGHYEFGAVGLASVGYGFGNGLRLEVEGDYRYNELQHAEYYREAARQQSFGGMANALFDLDIGSPYIYPYLGVGAGYMHVDPLLDQPALGGFAYQGIFGLALPISFVRGLSATVEYRFLGIVGASHTVTGGDQYYVYTATYKQSNDYNNSILVGLRYAFDAAPPAVTAPAQPALPPIASVARSYLVFFDWDSADLTARARQIVAEAASAAHQHATRIDVQGNADRSGTPAYNQVLSRRRADGVAAELVRDGVAPSEIAIEAFGDTRPLVATAAGVREAQNRRVAIIMH